MILVNKSMWNEEGYFNYSCFCSAFNIQRRFDQSLNSYVDTLDKDYHECRNGKHIKFGDPKMPYRSNSLGYRSDEFKRGHSGTHILFAGCSQTYGAGIKNEEDTWVGILSKNFDNLDGVYNLGRSGLNITQIVSNVLAYCKEYGNPQYMFILLPEIHRETIAYMSTTKSPTKLELDYLFYLQKQKASMSLLALELYCQSKNIRLIYSTWDSRSSEEMKKWDLSNFLNILNNHDQMVSFYTELQEDMHWSEKQHRLFATRMEGFISDNFRN